MPLVDGALYRNNQLQQMDDQMKDGDIVYIDIDKRERECKGCINLKKALELAEKDQEALVQTTKRFGEEITNWERKYVTLEKRSNDITAKMAVILEDSGNFENVNDQYSNTRLTKRFEDLYDIQWTSLSEWLQDNIEDMTELHRIKALTGLMKHAYHECHKTADSQLRQFLFLEDSEVLPLPHEDPELYRLRRTNGQTLKTRKAIKQKICKNIFSTTDAKTFIDMSKDNKDEVKGKLEEFFEEFIDIVWLMSISHPILSLNFDVIGKQYSGVIKERFTQYSCQETVIDKTLATNDVLEVVWPSVELKNGEGVCSKGDVITVREGKENNKDEDACEEERNETGQERKGNTGDARSESLLVIQEPARNSEGVDKELNGTISDHSWKEHVERVHEVGHESIINDGDDEFSEVDLT